MKRILFVDDEVQILHGLRTSLRKQRHEWDMSFAQSGEAALEAMRAAPIDVLVSDMRMPGMDGASLLSKVKDEFPCVVRIILSGHSEQEAVMRALPICHQFLAKPCEADALKNVIERACGLQAVLESETLRRVVGSCDKLPSLPRVYWELTRLMSDPDVSPKEIAAVVEQDPAMCAKILQIVNSAYFGLARRISAVQQAIAYLGLETVRTLALTVHVFSSSDKLNRIEGFSLQRLQEHAFLTGIVAKKIAPDPKLKDEAFAAALLHDVGKMVLALAAPDRVAQVIARARREARPIHAVELDLLGVTHAEVGAYLLGLWGLPVSIVEAAAYHHIPAAVPQRAFDTLATVHIADALVQGRASSIAGVRASNAPDQNYVESVDAVGDIPRWTALAAQEIESWLGSTAGG